MIKCVIWDLDNTLWQGILAEGDTLVFPKETKELIIQLDHLGIVQSIASRNDATAAQRQLERFACWEYFLFPQIGEAPKSVSIPKIADQLGIGLNSIAFVDDSTFELAQVCYLIPQVHCFLVCNGKLLPVCRETMSDASSGMKPQEGTTPWLACLLGTNSGQNEEPTYESQNRRAFYKAQQNRQQAQEQFVGSREDFLRSCHMVLGIKPAKETDLKRILELLRRTNQFRTFTAQADEAFCDRYRTKQMIYTATLTDRFADYRMVGVCFVKEHVIEQFCVSCRVGGRGIAAAFLMAVSDEVEKKVGLVECRFQLTDRNLAMLILLRSVGFVQISPKEEETVIFRRKKHPQNQIPWIEVEW
ncbi:MAG: HAD-IIIC family phosphatase [Lachnospiraceae bacterium]|jgi:FkbH-like protein|nr:HAD-IIIC family phosphatase [Lachnospiraceae bacterium]